MVHICKLTCAPWGKAHRGRKYAYKGLLAIRTEAWCIALHSAMFITFSSSIPFPQPSHLITLRRRFGSRTDAFSVANCCLHATPGVTEVQYVHDKLCYCYDVLSSRLTVLQGLLMVCKWLVWPTAVTYGSLLLWNYPFNLHRHMQGESACDLFVPEWQQCM